MHDAYPPQDKGPDNGKYRMVQLVSREDTAFDNGITRQDERRKCVRIPQDSYEKYLGADELADDQLHFSAEKDLENFIENTDSVETDGLREDGTRVPAFQSLRISRHPDGSVRDRTEQQIFCKDGAAHDPVSNGKPVEGLNLEGYQEGITLSASTRLEQSFADNVKTGEHVTHNSFYEGIPASPRGADMDFTRYRRKNLSYS